MKKIISLCLCAVLFLGFVFASPITAKAITADEIRAMFTDSPREIEDYAYSFAIVGDTQIVTYNDTFSKRNNLSKIYDWIVDNKDEKKIEFCFGMGDITDTNMPAEWALAHAQISKMDGVVPYSLVRGNHDLPLRYGIPDDTTDYYNLYMGSDAYMDQFDNGGFYNGNIGNAWRTFSVGDIDYLVFVLDYGFPDEVMEWAGPIIEAHPNHNVILTTHGYMVDGNGGDDGRLSTRDDPYDSSKYTDDSNSGEEMWDKFIRKYKNITMVMCGHISSNDITTKQLVGDHGNVVTNIMVNPQTMDAQLKLGAVAMMYFSEDGKNVQLEYYSTVQDAYFKGAERNIQVAVVNSETGKVTNPTQLSASPEATDPEATEPEQTTEATPNVEKVETEDSSEKHETQTNSSDTGDDANPWLWIAVIAVCGVAIVALVVISKKKPAKK